MALIKCPECGREVSSKASMCPHCGYPISDYVSTNDREAKQCRFCGSTSLDHQGYCNDCGMDNSAKLNDDGTIRKNPAAASFTICPACGSKNHVGEWKCSGCGYSYKIDDYIVYDSNDDFRNHRSHQSEQSALHCPNCHSRNIDINYVQVGSKTKETSEIRKKSILARTAHSIGRSTMIAMTGGLWALTPKKSKYIERGKENTKIKNAKFAICQNCGNSWRVE